MLTGIVLFAGCQHKQPAEKIAGCGGENRSNESHLIKIRKAARSAELLFAIVCLLPDLVLRHPGNIDNSVGQR